MSVDRTTEYLLSLLHELCKLPHETEWQSFRTKKDRSLELKSAWHECTPGRYKVAVKVVDIFGNDTMKIVDVGV